MGCYVPPFSAADTNHIAMVIGHFLDVMDLILVGDLNVDLSQPEVRYIDKDLVVVLAVEGPVYMATHL